MFKGINYYFRSIPKYLGNIYPNNSNNLINLFLIFYCDTYFDKLNCLFFNFGIIILPKIQSKI